jgi:thiamine biosynthesis lipoprotein
LALPLGINALIMLFQKRFKAMGGPVEILIEADERLAMRAFDLIAQRMNALEMRYSRYSSTSLVSQINGRAGTGRWTQVDQELMDLLDHAQSMYQQSKGRFDLTSGVLRQCWDFKSDRIPEAKDIECIRERVDWNKVESANKEGQWLLRLPLNGMEIDLGGIAKEFAVDEAVALLSALGITSALVNMAGDLRVIGRRASLDPWWAGIQHPRDPDRMIAQIPLVHMALATSGDYARYLLVNGRRYCHLINALTGWPVTYWQSISVIAPTALGAGSCSTIAMLLESDGLGFLQESGFRYLAIASDGKIHSH